MSFERIIVGDYGQVAKLTVTDVDTNAAADISGYTTFKMVFTDPDGNETPKTATLDTDGTDGVIKYTIESALFDEAGLWNVRAVCSSAAALLTSEREYFHVRAA